MVGTHDAADNGISGSTQSPVSDMGNLQQLENRLWKKLVVLLFIYEFTRALN